VKVTQHRRPRLGDPPQRLASLVPVAQFLGHHAQVVRDLQDQRIGIPEPPLPGRVRLLQNPSRSRRITRLLMNPGQLMGRGQHLRIILTQIDPPQLDGVGEQGDSAGPVPGIGKILSPLPGRGERRRLRHARHAARCALPSARPPRPSARFAR
jgi:hypothetical protein